MSRTVSKRHQRRINALTREAVATGPLWSYAPTGVPEPADPLSELVAQHWSSIDLRHAVSAAALATGIRSALVTSPNLLGSSSLLAEIEHIAIVESRAGESRAVEQATSSGAARWSATNTTVIVDGRCLQHPDFAQRGIGKLAVIVLERLRAWDARIAITVVTDPTLPLIDPAVVPNGVDVAEGLPTISESADDAGAREMVVFIDPAPMTHPSSPLDTQFASLPVPVRRCAVVHDFVPAHAPNIYLPNSIDKLEYLVRLWRLRQFDVLLANSAATAAECAERIDLGQTSIAVLPLPPAAHPQEFTPCEVPSPFVFAPLGADRRKNLPTAVAVLGHLAASGWDGDLVILSHMPDHHRLELNEFATSIGLDHARFHALSSLTDAEVAWLYTNASAVLITSFDEGLSLPVIESVDAGCPLVASDIAPHRELLGPDEPLCNPADPAAFAARLRRVFADSAPTRLRQSASIASQRKALSFDPVGRAITDRK